MTSIYDFTEGYVPNSVSATTRVKVGDILIDKLIPK